VAEPSATRAAAAGRRHRVQLALDWVLALVGLGVAVWQLAPRIAEVGNLGQSFGQLSWSWIAMAAVLSAASLLAYGELNRRFLTAGEDVVSGTTVQAVTIAGNAISLTVPAAGGAVGTVYTVHALAERGVSLALAGWAIAMAGIVTGVVLVVLAPLGFVGVGLLGVPEALSISVVLAVLIFGTGVVLLRRPRVRVAIVRRLVALARRVPVLQRRVTQSPAQAAWRFSDWIARRALTGRQWAVALGTALATWVLDLFALGACVAATGQPVPWPHVAFGYLAVQASIIANLTPGGTGPAEAGLLAALTAGGVPPGHAAIAVVLYRAASWIVPAIVGWAVFVSLVGRGAVPAGAERRRPREHARHARGIVSAARGTRLAHNLRHWHRNGDHARRRR
jgi:putative heme transporter